MSLSEKEKDALADHVVNYIGVRLLKTFVVALAGKALFLATAGAATWIRVTAVLVTVIVTALVMLFVWVPDPRPDLNSSDDA